VVSAGLFSKRGQPKEALKKLKIRHRIHGHSRGGQC
jgi:hypothetical protein